MRETDRPGDPGTQRGGDVESLTGRLLVATPALRDPNFERTVVLVVAHEQGGALGVVLNRATEVPVAEVLAGWGGLAEEPPVVFEGGPVHSGGRDLPRRSAPRGERSSRASTGFPARSGPSTSRQIPTCCARVSSRSGSSLGTPVGPPGSWKTRSLPVRGSCSTRCRQTPSPLARRISGRWCCAGRAVCWPPLRTTRRIRP